ncbi:GNAT family N-acetyltransferase [Corynebacterium mendelii]|uniref:GNAT family N-acetyltransferase n=1 Tax=Corynebacterium mendelii TaxID=2765362 RepID=A0A939E1Q9_9CORY|nr:GNAT family N-acetyltransferase [Corynebacterium mendelii]MBN9644193.1 GNAT family N-acetyltransferase [Corynebacterium mendelii]
MRIRLAAAGDAAEFVRLKELIVTGSYPFDYSPAQLAAWRPRAREAFIDLVGRDDHVQFVIDRDDGGRLAGCVSAALERVLPSPSWPAVHGYIGDMAVDDDVRGLGWGTKLLDRAMDWCVASGAETIRLTATASAVGFYRAAGFRPEGGHEAFQHMRWSAPQPD